MSKGNFNSAEINTENGHNSPFSPPNDWKGSSDDYMALMRKRFRDLFHYQRIISHLSMSLKSKDAFKISGPFKGEAEKILQKVSKKR